MRRPSTTTAIMAQIELKTALKRDDMADIKIASASSPNSLPPSHPMVTTPTYADAFKCSTTASFVPHPPHLIGSRVEVLKSRIIPVKALFGFGNK